MVDSKCKVALLRILAYSEGRAYKEIDAMYGDPGLSVDYLFQLKDQKLVTFSANLWSITVEGYVAMRQLEEPQHRVCKPTKAGPIQHTGSGTYKGEDLTIQSTRPGAYQYKTAPSRYGDRLEPLRNARF